MGFDPSERLDDVDRQILRELQDDGRISLAELSRRVSLSAPAVSERIRRLQDAGVITGYTARGAPRPPRVARPPAPRPPRGGRGPPPPPPPRPAPQ
jgi:DNA-binding Lrp family transcriptional regulator